MVENSIHAVDFMYLMRAHSIHNNDADDSPFIHRVPCTATNLIFRTKTFFPPRIIKIRAPKMPPPPTTIHTTTKMSP